jgi:hypothetical protein
VPSDLDRILILVAVDAVGAGLSSCTVVCRFVVATVRRGMRIGGVNVLVVVMMAKKR